MTQIKYAYPTNASFFRKNTEAERSFSIHAFGGSYSYISKALVVLRFIPLAKAGDISGSGLTDCLQ